jgi:hypothetical protein
MGVLGKERDRIMATKDTKKAGDSPIALEAAEAAFEKIRPEMAALKPEEVARVNADIPTAVTIALGAYEQLLGLRAEIVQKLPEHTVQHLDDLPTYALGALYAHIVSVPVRDDSNRTRKLLDEAGPLRESLLVAAEALVHRGLMDADRVAEIRGNQGNIDRGSDLLALATLFREAWPTVEHKTAVEWSEVERAATLGPNLLMALGVRGFADRTGASPQQAQDRARAFTLLLDAYDDCRQAATYLRWKQGDVDDFAPSLRPKPREKGTPDAPTPPAPPKEVKAA